MEGELENHESSTICLCSSTDSNRDSCDCACDDFRVYAESPDPTSEAGAIVKKVSEVEVYVHSEEEHFTHFMYTQEVW